MEDYNVYDLRGFKTENWSKLSEHKKIEALQELEYKMADEQGRGARIIVVEPLGDKNKAEFRDDKEPYRIYINSRYLESMSGYEAMHVVIHEGRHAYQYDVIYDLIDESELDEETKEKKETWEENFAIYRSLQDENYYYVHYRFQPIEDDAHKFADNEMRKILEHIHYDRDNCEEFIKKLENKRISDEKDGHEWYQSENYRQIIYDKIHEEYTIAKDIEKRQSNIHKIETQIKVLENGRSDLAPERVKESLEKSIQILKEQKEQMRDSFRDKYGVEPKDIATEKVDIINKKTVAHDVTFDEQQLESLLEEYAPKEREIQSLNQRADNMERYIKNIHNTESRIAELKKNREEIPNADSRIKKLENSRQKAHEFFKNEYNVQPEKAHETIAQLREQAMAEKRALKPTEEKMKILQERQKEFEMERREANSPTKDTMSKSY